MPESQHTSISQALSVLITKVEDRPDNSHSIEHLDAELTHARSLVQKLLSSRNRLSPIDSLIPDILRIIFHFFVFEDDQEHTNPWRDIVDPQVRRHSTDPHMQASRPLYTYEPSRRAMKISQVCHRWRLVAIQDARMWSEPLMTSEPWCWKMLSRSKQAPLSVYMRLVDTSPPSNSHFRRPSNGKENMRQRNTHAALKNIARIEALVLSFLHDRHPMVAIVFNMMRAQAPILRSLALLFSPDPHHFTPHESTKKLVVLPDDLFQSSVLPLRRLALRGLCIPWSTPILKNRCFTTLHFSNIPNWKTATLDQLFEVLADLPGLQSLYLELCVPLAESLKEIRTPSFPNLVSLTVRDDIASILHVLDHVVPGIPPSAHVNVSNIAAAVAAGEDMTRYPFVLKHLSRFSKGARAAHISLQVDGPSSFIAVNIWNDTISMKRRTEQNGAHPVCLYLRGNALPQTLPQVFQNVAKDLLHFPHEIESLYLSCTSAQNNYLLDEWKPVFLSLCNVTTFEAGAYPAAVFLNLCDREPGIFFPRLQTLILTYIHFTAAFWRRLYRVLSARQGVFQLVRMLAVRIRKRHIEMLQEIVKVEWAGESPWLPPPSLLQGFSEDDAVDDIQEGEEEFASNGFHPMHVEINPDEWTSPFGPDEDE